MQRHYGMDWLRIGAFVLLIFFHIGMVFVPWGFHVKTAQPVAWAEIPMLFANPWRLTLLFIVSGYASRALYVRIGGAGPFLRRRSVRLLVPLAFGIAVVVPPQTWVEVTTQHGYAGGFAWFYTHDYFRFGTLFGIAMPTWNHLWFVLYLWVYTAALCALALMPGAGRLQAAFDRIFAGWRALWVPLGFLLVTQFWLFHRVEDTHDLIHDGIAHLQYFPAFLFGYALAGSRGVLVALARNWAASSVLALASYASIVALFIAYPDFSFPTHGVTTAFRLARETEAWAAIAALIGIAERFLNRDHPWRATLAEATFPFYIVHQTIIVVVEAWLLPHRLGGGVEFAILVVATVAGCGAFYAIGRRIDWLRPLIGLKPAGQWPPVPGIGPRIAEPEWHQHIRTRADCW